ncbi:MAG: NAD(P)H-dependent oxidoreductase [Treponema sp.]|nr:NAD(P)H-dependent oxidoreductase [Treponema sp.]
MKVLLINGSPRHNSNTLLALSEMVNVFSEEGIETEIINIGTKAIQGCIACEKCREINKCFCTGSYAAPFLQHSF